MRNNVLSTSLIPNLAVSVCGSYFLYPPPQCVPMEATLNPVHGGEAQITSGTKGTFVQSNCKISTTYSIPPNCSMSEENTSISNFSASLPTERLPANNSRTF